MNHVKSITVLQTVMLMMLSAGLTNHVMIVPAILEKSGRDAWITVIAGAVLFVPWIALSAVILKKAQGKPLLEAIRQSSGKFCSYAAAFLIGLYLFLFAAYTLEEVTNWTKSSYMIGTPLTLMSLCIVVLSLSAALMPLRAIAITGGVLLPVVVILGFFVAVTNVQFKQYANLLPVLEQGFAPVWHGVPLIYGGLTQLFFLFSLQHHIRKRFGFAKLSLLTAILIVLTLGPTVGSIVEFGAIEAMGQRYPAYEQWRLVKVGKYIEHVDFLSIFQWLSGAFISISLSLHLIGDLAPASRKKAVVVVCAALLFLINIYPLNDYDMYVWMADLGMPAAACYTTFVALLLLILIRSKPSKPVQAGGPKE